MPLFILNTANKKVVRTCMYIIYMCVCVQVCIHTFTYEYVF